MYYFRSQRSGPGVESLRKGRPVSSRSAVRKEADSRDFDALLLPGGVANPDQLRMIPEAVKFIREFFSANKPVASICHGPWPLIEAGVVRGRTMTFWPSLKTDLINAGAKWVDQEVVTATDWSRAVSPMIFRHSIER
jgi:putative intracellular protease/amidase